MTTWKRGGLALTAALATGAVALTAVPRQAQAALRVCADPGNMPLSNSRGEGFENKIARVLARALDTGVENYYRPGVERGLTRTTLDADQCDLMLDMPADERPTIIYQAASGKPNVRVLTRNGREIHRCVVKAK